MKWYILGVPVSDVVKFIIGAVLLVGTGALVAAQYERVMWRVDCALHVPSACAAIEEVRSRDWKSWSAK